MTANNGTVLVQAQAGTDANAIANASGSSLGTKNVSTATTTVNSAAESDVDQGAQLSGINVEVMAQGGQKRSAQAKATSTSKALGVTTTATTVLDRPTRPPSRWARMLFSPPRARWSSRPTRGPIHWIRSPPAIPAASPVTPPPAPTNSGSIAANVTTAGGSTITASTLSVSANTPTPSIDTDDPRNLAEAGDFGSAYASPSSDLAFSNNVQFNSTATIEPASPQLLIGPDGKAITQSGVTFENSGGQISVDDIQSTKSGSASIAATGQVPNQSPAEAAFTNQISGNATFNYTGSYAAANITNESKEDLVIQNLQVTTPEVVPSLSVTHGIEQAFQYKTNVVTTPVATAINILNTGGGNIALAGLIQNPFGSTTISDTGVTGSITSSGAPSRRSRPGSSR